MVETTKQIFDLHKQGLIDRDTAWDAVYNSHSEVGRRALERIAQILNERADNYNGPKDGEVDEMHAVCTPVDLADHLLARAYPPRPTCSFPGCDDDATHGSRCIDHHDVKCGGCSQPATRRDAYDVADVCDYCGEDSDRRRKESERHEKRLAEMEMI